MKFVCLTVYILQNFVTFEIFKKKISLNILKFLYNLLHFFHLFPKTRSFMTVLITFLKKRASLMSALITILVSFPQVCRQHNSNPSD